MFIERQTMLNRVGNFQDNRLANRTTTHNHKIVCKVSQDAIGDVRILNIICNTYSKHKVS